MLSQEELSLNFMEYINCSENTTCRLCLKRSDPPELEDIFNSFADTTIACYITNFAEIPIDKEDCFSKVVCRDCLKRLHDIEDFKKLISDCYERLKTLYNVYSRNEEKSKLELLDFAPVEEIGENVNGGVTIKIEQPDDGVDCLETANDLYEEDMKIDIVQHNLVEPELDDNNIKVLNKSDVIKTEIKIKRKRIRKKKEEPKSEYSCEVCGKIFKSKMSKSNHIRMHTRKYFECDVCDRKFFRESIFIKHKLIHTEDKLMECRCKECGKQYTSVYSLEYHMETHSKVPKFQCDICGKCLSHPLTFKSHKESHELKMIEQKCEICNKIIRSRFPSSFRNHMKQHSNNRGKLCPKCGKIFTSLQGYAVHLKNHNGELEYKCEQCPKQYASKKSLQQHMIAVHTTVKRYQCNICGKAFALKTAWYTHGKVHARENPINCTMCDKKFGFQDHLKGHMRVVHGVIEDTASN